jgi:hypothetical protein
MSDDVKAHEKAHAKAEAARAKAEAAWDKAEVAAWEAKEAEEEWWAARAKARKAADTRGKS